MADFQNMDKPDYGYDWALEARSQMNDWIAKKDIKNLTEYQKMGKSLQLAIPTPEHYLPLLYVLGLQQKLESAFLLNDEMQADSLSMTSLKLG